MNGERFLLLTGDCIDLMRGMPDNSVDSVVTDPPYGLSFMGKAWDKSVPSADVWREALRVLKPGGHLLAFAGTRTQHRMAVNIEDAGFEIRDMIAWVYGSGFPKSLDVSKALDKAAGAKREVVGRYSHPRDGYQWHDSTSDGAFTSAHSNAARLITGPATPEADQWSGWGTALKPALEPITVARKPMTGTVAQNVMTHGTGALNIDGCRVGTSKSVPASGAKIRKGSSLSRANPDGKGTGFDANTGRWPANLIHDGSEEVNRLFPQTKAGGSRAQKNTGATSFVHGGAHECFGDDGSAARYFYCPKTSQSDRNDGLEGERNAHPTVKPTNLMSYLCRLVTPPGGLVLDPFMGSGSTGKAAMFEGFRFIGCELDPKHVRVAEARILAALKGMEKGRDAA